MKGIIRRALPAAMAATVLLCGAAWAQPLTAEIIDGDRAVTVAVSDGRPAVVEIVAPDGRLLSRTATANGRFVWNKYDANGGRVADGIYLLRVSANDAAGRPYSRIEQVLVGDAAAVPAAARAVATITGEGRGSPKAGQIARFSGANQIANSVITQSADGNIGINGNAFAVLYVNKSKAPTQNGAGTNAPPLFQTSGGKGGDAVSSGANGGKGAAIALWAGAGGNAASGGINGDGGSITLQPGGHGNGGNGGASGNVLLSPLTGNVGIGTTEPQRALQIGPSADALFTLSPSDGSPRAGFIRFGDKTGWRLIIGRNRESSGGPLNTGFTGNLITVEDNGALYQAGGYPFGITGGQHLCRTLANAITPCAAGAATQRYRSGAVPLHNGLAALQRLQPLAFTRTDTGDRTVGLAAEQVAAVDPRLVTVNAEGEPESVNYDLLTVVLVDALQAQQRQLQKQQSVIDDLAARLRKLEGNDLVSLP